MVIKTDHNNDQFDIVFTAYGAIGWLTDLKNWAEIGTLRTLIHTVTLPFKEKNILGNHSLSQVPNAHISQKLQPEFFNKHSTSPYPLFPKHSAGTRRYYESARIRRLDPKGILAKDDKIP